MTFKLQNDEKAIVNKFVKRFIPKNRQSRWKIILDGDSSKWKKLSMDDLWENINLSEKIKLVDIEKYMSSNNALANQKALLIKFSVGGLIKKGSVKDLVNQLVFEDSIILLLDDVISFASHHSGEWVVCSGK